MSKDQNQPKQPIQLAPPETVEIPMDVYQAMLKTVGQLPWEQVAPLMGALIAAGNKANA